MHDQAECCHATHSSTNRPACTLLLMPAGSAAGGGNTLAGSLDLCVSMLQETGPSGWQTADQLPDVANALAAAVAVVDYALLRSQRKTAPGYGAGADAAETGVAATVQRVKQEMGQVFPTLERAVQDAMQQIGAAGQEGTDRGGEGTGAGREGALDALLALQRLQLSLEHVQQSLNG
jgi:hypothetical protein